MTRLPVIALSLLAFGLPAQAMAGERYALLVGVRQYDKAELTPLEYTERDVSVLAEYLRRSGYKRVVLMTQTDGANESRYLPTAANIRKELKGLLEDRKADDTVVLAFCGHGVQFRGSDEPHFCPMDATLKDKKSLISLGYVYGELAGCKAKNKVLFSDCCRNDPLPKGTRAALSKQISTPRTNGAKDKVPENVVALFSCTAGEVAWETPTYKHGVFFHFLIKGLEGKAAGPGTGQVTIATLADYVQREVGDFVKTNISASARQRPEMFGRFSTPVVIADVTDELRRETPKLVAEASMKALNCWKDKKYKEMVQEANRGLAADAGSARLLMMRALAWERMRDGKNALLDANKAIKLDDKLSQPYHTRGLVYLELQNQPQKGVAEFTEAIKRNKLADGSFCARGRAYLQLKEYEKAADDFTAAIGLNQNNAMAYWARATIAYKDKDAAGAMRDLDWAIEKAPKFALAYLDRGRVKHFLLRKPADALPDYEEALKLDGRLAGAYFGRALIKLERKDVEGAIGDLTKALQNNPNHVAALVERSYAFLQKKDFRTALADARAAVKLDEKNASAWNNCAVAHAGLKKFDEAIRNYTKAIELDPKVPLYYANRAKSHRALKHTKEAEADDARAKALEKNKDTSKLVERKK
jgi:tetratricopeptide (TPR) repeat protein